MGWVRYANKIGRYVSSYEGFRIYCIKEPETVQRTETRKDGEYRITEFIKGVFVAIDKSGTRFEDNYVDALGSKIDTFRIIQWANRKFK